MTIELIRVFLASPGDVKTERRIVREVINAINQTLGRAKEIRFELVSWESDSIPAYGRDVQAIINDQIADMTQVELFVGIMWNRFGTPTPRAGSGTEEEFNRALDAFQKTGKPEIMFYFNRAPSDPATVEEAEQKVKVLKFKEEIQKHGLTQDYVGPEAFRELFRTQLEIWLLRHWPSAPSLANSELNVDAETFQSKRKALPVTLTGAAVRVSFNLDEHLRTYFGSNSWAHPRREDARSLSWSTQENAFER